MGRHKVNHSRSLKFQHNYQFNLRNRIQVAVTSLTSAKPTVYQRMPYLTVVLLCTDCNNRPVAYRNRWYLVNPSNESILQLTKWMNLSMPNHKRFKMNVRSNNVLMRLTERYGMKPLPHSLPNIVTCILGRIAFHKCKGKMCSEKINSPINAFSILGHRYQNKSIHFQNLLCFTVHHRRTFPSRSLAQSGQYHFPAGSALTPTQLQ